MWTWQIQELPYIPDNHTDRVFAKTAEEVQILDLSLEAN